MTTLTTGSFSDDQKIAIEARIANAIEDEAALLAANTKVASAFDRVIDFDAASQLVQEAAIDELITILHGIVTTRDGAEPTEAPHIIKFGADFPLSVIPNLSAATSLPAYIAALPAYSAPFATATVANGAASWELYHTPTPPGPPEVVDPSQPTVGELTPAFPILQQEFDERNDERLQAEVGSFVMKGFLQGQSVDNTAIIALIQQRKAFWESVGFPIV